MDRINILSNEQLEYMLLPRLAALSEVQWTQPANKSWERFQNSLSHIISIYNVMGVNYGKHIYEIAAKYDVPTASEGKVVVTLSTLGDSPMYYTLDGSQPTEESTRYTRPIAISKSCVLQAIVVRDNVKTRTFKKEFNFNKATVNWQLWQLLQQRNIHLPELPSLQTAYVEISTTAQVIGWDSWMNQWILPLILEKQLLYLLSKWEL